MKGKWKFALVAAVSLASLATAAPAATVSISGLTVTNGRSSNGRAGGIQSSNTIITVSDSAIVDNVGEGVTGAVTGGGGGALGGSLTLSRSLVARNAAVSSGVGGRDARGGGVAIGNRTIVDSTIVGNRAEAAVTAGGDANGLSFETCGRLWVLVTPSRRAGRPRSSRPRTWYVHTVSNRNGEHLSGPLASALKNVRTLAATLDFPVCGA